MFNRPRQKARCNRKRIPSLGLLLAILLLSLSLPLHAADEQTAYKHFQIFAREWMTSLDKTNRQNFRNASRPSSKKGASTDRYACYGPECEIWIKKTDSAQTPYLGFIRYQEKHYRKKTAANTSSTKRQDHLLASFPVTEIFRFSDNRWVH